MAIPQYLRILLRNPTLGHCIDKHEKCTYSGKLVDFSGGYRCQRYPKFVTNRESWVPIVDLSLVLNTKWVGHLGPLTKQPNPLFFFYYYDRHGGKGSNPNVLGWNLKYDRTLKPTNLIVLQMEGPLLGIREMCRLLVLEAMNPPLPIDRPEQKIPRLTVIMLICSSKGN